MALSISEVVGVTGLTSRTLRHYHAIGLLEPAWTAPGGRRYYEQEQLLRLQEILLLRQLGLPLDEIAATLADPAPGARSKALSLHLAQLEKERSRLDRLIDTVRLTIMSLEEGADMSPEEIFDGLVQNPYEAEARERWGHAAVDESNRRVRNLSKEDRELLTSGRGFQQVHEDLAALKHQGLAIEDERVQQVIARHYKVVSLAWTPNREAYLNLGEMYLQDERFRRNIGQGDDSLVEYLAAAMKVYANANLSA